jgi:phosphopantetheinyl transferase
MSPTGSGSRHNAEIRGGGPGQSQRCALTERRSVSRPRFFEGWRKPVGSQFAAATQNALHRPNKIQIWVASTDGLLRAGSCLQLLTDNDWTALNRIQNAANRNSAIAARVLLRLGLSRSIDRTVAPAEWDFAVTDHQRPIVANGLPQVHFSVSHIDQLAVVAISPSLNIGVDVESVDQHVTENVMAAFCHGDEQRSVRGLSDLQRIREFVRLWTLKEAYTKMLGVGHALDFKTIKFMLDPVNLASTRDAATGPRTQFENFYVSVNHALFHASLAIEEPARIAGSTEVQIISLIETTGAGAALVSPSCA